MKKIGIVLFNYPLGVSPSLINTAIMLEGEGYDVHIFINRKTFSESEIEFHGNNIHPISYIPGILNTCIPVIRKGRVKQIPLGKLIWSAYSTINQALWKLNIFPGKNDSAFNKRLLHHVKYFLRDHYEFYKGILNFIHEDYICIFGIEAHGLVVSNLLVENLPNKKRIPVVYYNLELLLEKECKSTKNKILKNLERQCNQKSLFTIIPDKRRAKHLIADNDIPEEKIVCVPVSALGEAHEHKSDYFHRKLKIPQSKKIILYAGNIISWSMSLEIAEAAQKWDDDKVLVLHTWRTDLDRDVYVSKIKRLTENKKVYLSLNPVEWDDLPELLSSADIGVLFYQNIGENFYETGSSSNKLAQYLQVGLPLITSDYPSFKEVIEKYGCGKCTNDPKEIEKLVNEIFLDYDAYRKNSFKCYEEGYEFSKHFNVVIDKIRKIDESTR